MSLSPLSDASLSLAVTPGSLRLGPHLLFFTAHIILACLESWALWFPSLLLRIHTANMGPGLTSHLEGRKTAFLYLFVVQACPTLFEIAPIPEEICGVDWSGGAEGMRQSLRTVSTLWPIGLNLAGHLFLWLDTATPTHLCIDYSCFHPQLQSWVATETILPTKPKILTLWSSTEKVWCPLTWKIIAFIHWILKGNLQCG